LKRVQLTISGCVGPCDVPNVVVITSSSGTEWLGNIDKVEQYRSLLEWAVRCRDAGEMLVLPSEFHRCRISPFVVRAQSAFVSRSFKSKDSREAAMNESPV